MATARARASLLALVFAIGALVAPAAAGPCVDLSLDRFKTAPHWNRACIRPNITYSNEDTSLAAPGHIFLAPFDHLDGGFGPMIFDQQGRMKWFGEVAVSGGHRSQNFFVCDYMGQNGTHLCWSEAFFGTPEVVGTNNRIFNNNYEPQGEDYSKTKGFTYPNPHELNMLPGGYSFLQSVYKRKTLDLTPYGGIKKGQVLDGCFQEIDVETRAELFRWCYLDWLPEWETYLFLDLPINNEQHVNLTSTVAGTGTDSNMWDFLHLNAVDKNDEGDYIISARHLNQVIMIAGADSRSGQPPGTVLWRFGGKATDFEAPNDTLFSRQHGVRFVNTTANTTTISLFNNAWEGINEASARTSSAMVIALHNATMQAELVHQYLHPHNGLSAAQGSVQHLPNGNVFVGWGRQWHYSEYTQAGALVTHAVVSEFDTVNYRSFKYPWAGFPKTSPRMVAYCQSCAMTSDAAASPLVAYVSWNGATEVRYWRFYVSFNGDDGPWVPAGTFDWADFETKVYLTDGRQGAVLLQLGPIARHVLVEALDERRAVLGATTARTWVPPPRSSTACGPDGCAIAGFDYTRRGSAAGRCGVSLVPLLILLALVVVGIESLNHMLTPMLARLACAGVGVGGGGGGHARGLYASLGVDLPSLAEKPTTRAARAAAATSRSRVNSLLAEEGAADHVSSAVDSQHKQHRQHKRAGSKLIRQGSLS